MICNSSLTVYHKGYDKVNRKEIWTRYNYDNVWFFNKESAVMNKGYEQANNVQIRVPYGQNSGLSIGNFSIGDIVVKGTLDTNIETQQDLSGNLVYNITSINDNIFGNNPHIHISGN